MWRFFEIIHILLLASLLTSSSASIAPKEVHVSIGEGFIFRSEPEGNSTTFKSCSLSRNGNHFVISPGQNQPQILPTQEIIHPFSTNQRDCGVRVLNVSPKSGGIWKLISVDENSLEKPEDVKVFVKQMMPECVRYPQDCVYEELERHHALECNGEMCKLWYDGKMTVNNVHLRPEDDSDLTQIRTPIKTESGSTVLECTANEHMQITQCFIEHVTSERKYLVQEGLQDTRYSSYKSDFELGTCQFEIPNEVKDDEIGMWRMTISAQGTIEDNLLTYNLNRTCQFHVANELAKDKLIQRTKTTVIVKTIENKTKINCAMNAYYPLTLCYLSGESVMVRFNDKDILNGKCTFDVAPGNWTCGFNGPNEEEDEDFLQHFEVKKYNTEVMDEAVIRHANGTTTIECHVFDRQPIKRCMIVSASGKAYRPTSDNFKSNSYSFYRGGSMSTGDCGVEFKEGVEIETGLWECVIGKTDGSMLSIVIKVHEENLVEHGESSH